MNMFFKRTLSILLLVYLTAFVFLFVFSVLSFHGVYVKAVEKESTDTNTYMYELSLSDDPGLLADRTHSPEILSSFKLSWIINRSILLFSRYFIAIHITGVLLCFSLIFPYTSNPAESGTLFLGSLGRSIVIMIFLTFIYTGLSEGIAIMVRKSLDNQAASTNIAVNMFKKGNKSLNEGNYESANTFFSTYIEIDRGNSIIKQATEWTDARLMIKQPAAQEAKKSAGLEKKIGYFSEAGNYYSSGDYYSSFYYAYLASQTDEGSLKERSLRLMALSREKLAELDSVEKDRVKHRYYLRKMNALEDLRKGNICSAYYAFKSLVDTHPGDKDAELFFKESEKAVKGKFFFVDALERMKDLNGIKNILYSVKSGEGMTTVVSIGKYIETKTDRYFFNIEAMVLNADGELVLHYRAPYGKLIKENDDWFINLNAIKKDKEVCYKPEYLAGKGREDDVAVVSAVPAPDEFGILSPEGMEHSRLSLVSLLRIRSIAERYGYLKEAADAAVLSRLKLPFTFFIFSMFAIGTGWFFRIRNKRLPLMSLPLIAVIPFAVHHIVMAFNYASDLFYTFILFKISFIPALSVLLGVQGILLFLALVVVSENGR